MPLLLVALLFLTFTAGTASETLSAQKPPSRKRKPAAAAAKKPPPQPERPTTRRVLATEILHGASVSDPYRWLEDGGDSEVMEWMRAQDKHARAHLKLLPARDKLARRFAEVFYVDSMTPPHRKGKRFFYSRTHTDRDKAIVYCRQGEGGDEEILLDPNAMGEEGENIAIRGWVPSYDGRYVAYKVSQNNSDAAVMYVRDVNRGEDLGPDIIDGAKYANPSWTPNASGFFYTWLPNNPEIPLADLPGRAEVRFHRLGDYAMQDAIIHPCLGDPTKFIDAELSRDGRWLFLFIRSGWTRNDVYFRDLKSDDRVHARPAAAEASSITSKAGFQPLVVGTDALYHVIAWKNRLYIHTNEGAPRYRVFSVDAERPGRERWREIVPERAEAALTKIQIVGNHLVLLYVKNAVSQIEIRTLDGKPVRMVTLPGLGTASALTGNPDDDIAFFHFASYTHMPQVYRLSIDSGDLTIWDSVDYPIDHMGMVSRQVWYGSKDGTRVSMFLVHRRDMQRDGDNPLLLTGYGGFNASVTPGFSPSYAVWVENGGILAVPNLRGGGEYGEQWHRAGMLGKKQNVFDDFIAAAEYLIAERYTRPERLAIRGRSNGGLLVGAAMTQRPDLFRAVVCGAPLLDMVRYHHFGSGKTWVAEYGSADDATQFKSLFAYSPYHHVAAGVAYPALLTLSPDSDDRVDPMHARKFIAAMQWAAQAAPRPVWLRVEKQSGHGGADLVRQKVEEEADAYAFLFDQLGMK